MTIPDLHWRLVLRHKGLNFDEWWEPYIRERFYTNVYAPYSDYGVVACCII